jgi:hypothetical protein
MIELKGLIIFPLFRMTNCQVCVIRTKNKGGHKQKSIVINGRGNIRGNLTKEMQIKG